MEDLELEVRATARATPAAASASSYRPSSPSLRGRKVPPKVLPLARRDIVLPGPELSIQSLSLSQEAPHGLARTTSQEVRRRMTDLQLDRVREPIPMRTVHPQHVFTLADALPEAYTSCRGTAHTGAFKARHLRKHSATRLHEPASDASASDVHPPLQAPPRPMTADSRAVPTRGPQPGLRRPFSATMRAPSCAYRVSTPTRTAHTRSAGGLPTGVESPHRSSRAVPGQREREVPTAAAAAGQRDGPAEADERERLLLEEPYLQLMRERRTRR